MWRNPDVLLLSKQFQFVKNHYHCSTDFHSYSAHYFPNQKLGNNEKIIWILNSSSHSPCIQWHLEKTKVKVKEKSLSHVWLFATPWTVAYQAPLSMGFLQARVLEWGAISFSRGSSQPRDRTQVSCIADRCFTIWVTREAIKQNPTINNTHIHILGRSFLTLHAALPWKEGVHVWFAAAAKSRQSCPTVQPQRRQPTRLLCPWDSLGKNTGVGCHFLLQCMKVKSKREVAQSCLTLCNPVDCSLPGSSVHGIF